MQHPIFAETRIWGNQLSAILTLYTGKGVTPEVNLRECIPCMFLPYVNKAVQSGFYNKRGYHHESKTEVSGTSKMDMCRTK